MKCSVLVATVRASTVGATIASIRRQSYPEWELLLLAQGHDAALRSVCEAARRDDSRVRLLNLDELGKSRAINAGFRAASGEIIAMTDDDCEAREDWLATLVECFQREPAVGLVGGALLPPERRHGWLAAVPSNVPADMLYDPIAHGRKAPDGFRWIGGNFAMRRSVVEEVGPYDECLGPGSTFPYADDTDYLLRLEAHGVKMRSTPHVVVHHTFGYRYGLRSCVRSSRNAAAGNGGLAGKLSLLGDPRGRDWLNLTRRECTLGWLSEPALQRLPTRLVFLWNFSAAYRRVLYRFRLDPVCNLLRPAI